MKISLINIALLMTVSTLALVGCSTNTQSQNTGAGAVTGAVVGGLAGSLFGGGAGKAVAVGVGAVAGALIGGTIGHNMDSSDNSTMNQSMSNNNANQSNTWVNHKTGVKYSIKPTSKVMAYQGNNYCRQYQSTATISGKREVANGIACRQNNGSWVTMNS